MAERGLPVVSILGATPTSRIEAAFGPGTQVLRFMPNVAAEVGHGTFCGRAGADLDPGAARACSTCSACWVTWWRWRSG